MSDTLRRIVELVRDGNVRISVHGYDEIVEDGMLQRDRRGNPIHVVWGIPRGQTSPAVLVTAYRPDPARWSDDFLRRK